MTLTPAQKQAARDNARAVAFQDAIAKTKTAPAKPEKPVKAKPAPKEEAPVETKAPAKK